MSVFHVSEEKARQWLPIVEEKHATGDTHKVVAKRHNLSAKTLSWYTSYFNTNDGVKMMNKIKIDNAASSSKEVMGVRSAAKLLRVSASMMHRRLNAGDVPPTSPNAAVRFEDHRINGFSWKWRDEAHLRAWFNESLSVKPMVLRSDAVRFKVEPRQEEKVTISESVARGDMGVVVRHDLADQLSQLLERLNDPIVRKYRKMMGQSEELGFEQLANMVIELGLTNWDME